MFVLNLLWLYYTVHLAMAMPINGDGSDDEGLNLYGFGVPLILGAAVVCVVVVIYAIYKCRTIAIAQPIIRLSQSLLQQAQESNDYIPATMIRMTLRLREPGGIAIPEPVYTGTQGSQPGHIARDATFVPLPPSRSPSPSGTPSPNSGNVVQPEVEFVSQQPADEPVAHTQSSTPTTSGALTPAAGASFSAEVVALLPQQRVFPSAHPSWIVTLTTIRAIMAFAGLRARKNRASNELDESTEPSGQMNDGGTSTAVAAHRAPKKRGTALLPPDDQGEQAEALTEMGSSQ